MNNDDSVLRMAGDNEAPAVTNVESAVLTGSTLDLKRAMLLVLARHIDNKDTNPTALAALVNRVSTVKAEIEAIEAQVAAAAGKKKGGVASSNGTSSAKWRPQAI